MSKLLMVFTIVIHRVGKSGEGYVVRTAAEMLKEKGEKFVVATLGKQSDAREFPIRPILPFDISRADRYQRLLVYLSARRFVGSTFLNFTGIPIPLSRLGIHVIYAGVGPPNSQYRANRSLLRRVYEAPLSVLANKLRMEAKRAHFAVNSRYSGRNLKSLYGVDSKVIYPPVDVEAFSRAFHEDGGSYFLTIGRIQRDKQLERAVRVAHLSKIRGVVVGFLSDRSYLNELERLNSQLGSYVKFIPNAPREKVIELASKASCYFHPTLKEHFGLPVVEAMAAGLPPVVPRESGGAEVWEDFVYSELEEAATNLIEAAKVGPSYRRKLQERAMFFSPQRFKEELWNFIISLK